MRSSTCVVTIAALSAALAACGSSSSGGGGGGNGDACDAKTPCADGSVCDLTDPAGAKCIDAEGDLDGDGIPNAMDKCNHMPGGMYDEDNDGIGDECDKCPIAPPPSTPDSDHDDVDSPCDPNPTTDGEKIVLFNGFNGNTLPTGFTVTTPADWVVGGGEVTVTPTGEIAELLTAPLPSSSLHTVVQTAYRADMVTSQNESDAVVGGIVHLPMGDSVALCGSQRLPAGDHLRVKTQNSDIVAEVPNSPSLFDSAGLYTVALQLEGAKANCAVLANGVQGAGQGSTNAFQANQAALGAQGAKLRFEYILVVQKP